MFFLSSHSNTKVESASEPKGDEFQLLPQSASASADSLPLNLCETCKGRSARRSRLRSSLTVISLFVNTGLFAFLLSIFISNPGAQHGRNELLKRTSFFSPVFDRLDIPLYTTVANGSLFKNDPPSIFREPPSDKVDAAWDRITTIRPFLISTEDVVKLGKDPSKTVRVPLDWNYGPDKHLAILNGQHLIHCLDSLRKSAYYDYYHRPTHGNSPGSFYWTHLSHCIDMLRQTLTCMVNVDTITFNWVADQDDPYPDLNTHQICRDHEAVLRWQQDHKIEIDSHPSLTIPKGVVPFPQSPQYYEMFGIPDPNK